jgi:aminopeptidase N
MFRHVAAFEFRYQRRSPVFWVGCLLFFFLTFGSVVVDTIHIGDAGNVNVNSPYAMLQTLTTMGVFAMFVLVALVANVIIRDDESGFAPILRSTPLTRGDYLNGRFVGAVLAVLCVFACVPLAIGIGTLMPWLDPQKVGPFHLGHYLFVLFCIGFPTLLALSAIFFALATATRSMMWSYVGAVALLAIYTGILVLVRDPRHYDFVALVDPFALVTVRVVTKYWTAAERNTQMPAMAGLLLANRALWLGIAAATYAVAYRRFRFAVAGVAASRGTTRVDATPPAVREACPLPMPQAGGRARLAQLVAMTRLDVGFVVRSPAFFVLLALGIFNSLPSLWFAGEFYGTSSFPVTRLMCDALAGSFVIIPMIVAIYYSGELVWRDRDRRMHEIVDSTSAPDWAHLVPKFVAVTVVLFAVHLVGVATGISMQLARGYTHLQLEGYLLWFLLPSLISAVQLAVLSVFVQVLVPAKYYGWGIMLLYVVAQIALASTGFEHHLYNFGDSPPVPLSDMNGLGRFWVGRAWFEAYWSAICCALAIVAYALWRRGAVDGLSARLRGARWRLAGTPGVLLAVSVAASLALGGYIYWNTNALNQYLPGPDADRRLADAERELLPFETVPQPRIVAVRLDVGVHPSEVRVVTEGSYRIENRTQAPIRDLHLHWDTRLRLDAVHLPGARLIREWPRFHYAIYRLDTPLAVGEQRVLGFHTTLEERGFPNSDPLTRIVANGTFVNNSEITPALGMTRDGLLTDRAKRRKYGLPADLRMASLDDERARDFGVLRRDSDWVSASIAVTTDADQVPVAPGYRVSEEVRGGRRRAEFRTEAPIQHFFSIQSAHYQVARQRWRNVDLEVYYDPQHPYNVRAMLDSMAISLETFTEAFSPYQFRQARILEFPAYAMFAQSFANTIPYSEGIGFISHPTDPTQIDFVSYVTAHEIGHQWWGHQLLSSDQQGASMLVESFAQYSALLVMEKRYGREQVRRFLKYELDRYLSRRAGEAVEEMPLARVEAQPYIYYQKGTLAMYWLAEVVGRDAVHRAMRRLLAEHGFRAAPYPNTRDFLRLLREEAGPAHDALIADLFEKITLVDVHVESATVAARADGRYDVHIGVVARKLYADGQGKETEAPLDEPFDVGAFAAKPGDADFAEGKVLAFERRPVHSGRQEIVLTLASRPAWVGVDPYNKRIDRNSDDNLLKVAER